MDGQTAKYEINGTDRDGNTLRNGETKYFRDWSGYLLRGKVYHNINNMWWVLLADGKVRNVACFDLFDLKETDFRGEKERTPTAEGICGAEGAAFSLQCEGAGERVEKEKEEEEK